MAGGLRRQFTREGLRRLSWYEQQLDRSGFTTDEAKAELEIAERTVRRDIELLQQLEVELTFDRSRRRWILTGRNLQLGKVELSEAEYFALMAVEPVIDRYRGTQLARRLESAFAKILPMLERPERPEHDGALPMAFSGPPTRHSNRIDRQYDHLISACRTHRRLDMLYFTPNRNEETWRRLDPYTLLEYAGDWYVVGFDHHRGEIRMFALGDRIRDLKETGEHFELDPTFDRDAFLRSGMGLFHGGRMLEVELRFDASAAPYIREKQWVPNEVKDDLPDGGLLLRMHAPNNPGLRRFILQWGAEVVVLAPPELREQFRQEYRRAHHAHEDPTSEPG